MSGQHHFESTTQWTGNKGTGTNDYRSYERSHSICVKNKVDILGSSVPAFLGDATKHNPEDLLLASVSGCHMLWYLHLCAAAGVIVTDYTDHATGIMQETADGGGHFTSITLNPLVTVTHASMIDKAKALHHDANKLCFIANSLNFPVYHKPLINVQNA